ncbi:polysaccharide deacetylase family protein [Saccharothrix deserti]|uniref:polysaccharide deacetylase family protein n=1 Tax=Saccharothrix deserti TaxID=2593674 RepID=UPI00131B113D|nr:polysaccharide deacetylase family protein [Saccharothrix deserti]
MAHLPSMAAVGVSAVFTGVGIWLDGEQPGVVLGVLMVFGALLAAAMVRPVGLWTVVPAPPLLYAGLVVAVAALRGKSLGELTILVAPPVVRAFPHLVVAVGVGLLVAGVRLGDCGGGAGLRRPHGETPWVDARGEHRVGDVVVELVRADADDRVRARQVRAHWVSLLLGLGLLMGVLSFHAYATSLADEPTRAQVRAEPVVDGTAALVFHGGPHPRWTPRVLDELAARGMKATFFLVGAQVNEHPELVRRMVAEGHEVGVSGFRAGETTRLGTAFAQNALADAANIRTGLSEPEPDTPDLHRYDAKQIAADLDPDRVIRLHVTSTTPGVIDLLADARPARRFTTLTTATGRGAAMTDAGFGARSPATPKPGRNATAT